MPKTEPLPAPSGTHMRFGDYEQEHGGGSESQQKQSQHERTPYERKSTVRSRAFNKGGGRTNHNSSYSNYNSNSNYNNYNDSNGYNGGYGADDGQADGSEFKRKKKKPETNKYAKKRFPKSISKCKQEIRSINRLLNSRKLLPSTKRTELERRVKALTVLQQQLTNTEVDKANATRYHGVKFVERKKVLRKLESIEKSESITDEALKAELLVDLNYTTYYPDEVKYISLFPANPENTSEQTRGRQREIREAIRAAMASGGLPKDARDVDVKDRKAIRRNNRRLLRTVNLAHGLKNKDADSSGDDDSDAGSDNDDEDEKMENADVGAEAANGTIISTSIEDDDFFE
ncbi:18S rRNA maturation protein [Coemansia interrupta]|uniref:rRNA-processing protein EFG1 n=1 Tax=Coemansia interrupta TaxID=1126814 RepID=A0A9W8LFL7_9FUNG|nr:18S rRNA maturation protein [Coemansia interrupta]